MPFLFLTNVEFYFQGTRDIDTKEPQIPEEEVQPVVVVVVIVVIVGSSRGLRTTGLGHRTTPYSGTAKAPW